MGSWFALSQSAGVVGTALATKGVVGASTSAITYATLGLLSDCEKEWQNLIDFTLKYQVDIVIEKKLYFHFKENIFSNIYEIRLVFVTFYIKNKRNWEKYFLRHIIILPSFTLNPAAALDICIHNLYYRACWVKFWRLRRGWMEQLKSLPQTHSIVLTQK